MSELDRADIGIWRLAGDTPQRYMPDVLQYEKYLEDWIERDPTLISAEMQIVGRQVSLDTGFLDLFAIDNLGRWAVIELKKRDVRRDTVAQAFDYAGCLAEMSSKELKSLVTQCLEKRSLKLQPFLKRLALDDSIFEHPEILIYVVGTSRDINLDRMLKHTTFQGKPVQVVTFDVYKNSDGEHVLLRQLTESQPTSSPPVSSSTSPSKKASQDEKPITQDARLTRLMDIAKKNGIGREFKKVYDLATKFGLYPKTYKWSIMCAPPQNKNRVLICAWVNAKDGLFDVYINTDAFAEFYPISQRKARQMADKPLRYYLDTDQTEEFIEIVQNLFDEITRNS